MANVKDLAYEDYLAGMKYKDIAEKYGVSLATVKSWKTRYKWQKSMHTKEQKVCIQNKKGMHTKPSNKERKKGDKENENGIIAYEGLTDKQRLFCIYWIKNKNATIAAIKAGYAADSAHVEGSRLLRNVKVREYINLFIQEVKNNVMIDASEIVERYMKIAFADMTDFVDFFLEEVPVIVGGKIVTTKDAVSGEPIPVTKTVNVMRFKDATMVDGGLICEISQGKDGAKIKLEDRQRALDWLAKYFLMNPLDKHKIDYDKKKLELEERKISGESNGDAELEAWVESVIEADDTGG